MQELVTYIAEFPLLQALFLVLLWGISEKMGLPITAILKKLLRINGGEQPPKWASELQENYNHNQTPALTKLSDAVYALSENIKIMIEQERAEVNAMGEMHSDIKESQRENREAFNQLLRRKL